MLNIVRMGLGRQQYYLDAVAVRDGIDDYYLAKGEEPGHWPGTGAAQLGLGGRVTGEQLHRVLDGTHPDTGDTLAVHPARKVPGFDLTFRKPKSVSLLWGLSDRTVGREVATAHDEAVAAALAYLEREAGWTRSGAQGAEAVRVRGFVGAAFRHRTSRADDPLLHTHVLVANLAETADDGVWRTLDSRRLYAHARTAGFLYQAQLRHELTARLGVAWGPVTNGCWRAKTLMSAVQLGVFTELDRVGPRTLEELEDRLGLHPRSSRDFLDALVALDLLDREDGHYRTTPESDAFLVDDRPASLTSLLRMFNDRLYPFWGHSRRR